MPSRTSTALGILIATALGLTAVIAQEPTKPPADAHEAHEMVTVLPDKLKWAPGPKSLPAGCEMAALEADPAKAGMFTIRLKLPADYRIPPHTHPRVERITVLSGTFRLGTGRTFDEAKLGEFPAGAFLTMPPGMEHFAATGKDQTIIQLTGIGPWEIHYLNPADDPRKR